MKRAYFKCICGTGARLLVKRLQDEGYEVINLQKQRQYRAEALAYKVKLPFAVNGEEVIKL